ncbi:unnamed protein product, partial [Symbiodinium necroappetens]
MTKRKLQQKPPLHAKHVFALEEIVCGKVANYSAADKVAAGFFLFAIYARARHSDAQNSSTLEEDLCEDEDGDVTGFLEARIERSKTSTTLERKTRWLPLVATIHGISDECWGLEWMKVLAENGPPLGPGRPLLPGPMENGQWQNVPLSPEDEERPDHRDEEEALQLLDPWVETIASSVKTLKNLAFISSYSPGQADDAPLMEVLSSLLSEPDLSIALKGSWRAAFHEAYAVATAELKQQVERSEEVQVRALTQPERAERYEKQVKRLSGVDIKGSSEPSERLVDVCVAIYERNQLQYVPWSRCSSREQEAQNESRKEVKLALDGSGKVKVDSASKEVVADTSTEVLVMQALQRRALAMEQANIVSYTLLDLWHQRLMKARLTDPPPGYSRPSFDQLRLADQKLFSELQDETRSGIQALSSGRPVDNLIKDVMHRAEVSSLLLPLPAPSVASVAKSTATAPPPQPTWKGNGKGKGKLKGKTGRMGTPRMPAELEGCKAYTQKG